MSFTGLCEHKKKTYVYFGAYTFYDDLKIYIEFWKKRSFVLSWIPKNDEAWFDGPLLIQFYFWI